MNLVDDDRVHRAQRLARVRRQQQIERLRRRDQNVGRLPLKAGALGLRRVAGADGDGGEQRVARAADRLPASGAAGCARRRPPAPSAVRCKPRGSAGDRCRRRKHQAVQAPEERASVLPLPSEQESASILLGRWQASRAVGTCRGVERRLEPLAHGRVKWRQRIGNRTSAHDSHLIMAVPLTS